MTHEVIMHGGQPVCALQVHGSGCSIVNEMSGWPPVAVSVSSRGHRVTFEQYAHQRLPALLRVAQSICGDRQLGEDLVQDVLVKVHAQWTMIQSADRPDAYVRRMLVNEHLSWRRKWARIVPFADVGTNLIDDGSDHAARHGERDALLREIAQLPDRQRVVVVLRYLADLSDADIADALGCKETTVRVHASRALAALRVSPLRLTQPHSAGGRPDAHRG
jgi:RNA polymerase sigma-70 factor (sigma-E family)